MLLASVLSANLQTAKRFFIATVYQISINIFIIIGIFLARATQFLPWISIGMVIGNVISFCVLIHGNRNIGMRYKPLLDFKDKNLRRFFVLLLPIMLSTLIVEINQIVDRNFASSMGEGIVSTLSYASKIQGVFTAFIGMAVGKALFPDMARTASDGDIEGLKKHYSTSLKTLLPILLPVAAGLFLLAEPIIRILLERGAFGSDDTLRTASVLRIFTFTMFAANISQMQTRMFYARQKTRITAIVSAGQMILNIICILILVNFLDYRGLALATSISGMAALAAYQVLLRRDLGPISVYPRVEWLKLSIALAAMTVFVWLGRRYMPLMTGDYLKCLMLTGLLVCGAILLYGGLLIALRTEVAGIAVEAVRKFRNRRNKTSGNGLP